MIRILANILAAMGAFLGIINIAHKKKIGFIIFLGVECCMGYIGFFTQQWGIVAMAIIYFFSNIYAWYQWSKE